MLRCFEKILRTGTLTEPVPAPDQEVAQLGAAFKQEQREKRDKSLSLTVGALKLQRAALHDPLALAAHRRSCREGF